MTNSYDKTIVDFNKMLEDMNRVFDNMEKVMEEVQMEYKPEWERHRLAWPRRINGRWYWPGQIVARKFCFSPGGGFYRYGDSFDLLRDRQQWEQ